MRSARSAPGAAASPSGSASTPKYDAKTFIAKNGQSGFLDFESSKPEKLDPDVVEMFGAVDPADKGDVMVVYGWTMAEDLVKLGQR